MTDFSDIGWLLTNTSPAVIAFSAAWCALRLVGVIFFEGVRQFARAGSGKVG